VAKPAETHRPSLLERLLILALIPLIHTVGLSLRIQEKGRAEWGPRGSQSEAPLWALWHETIVTSIWYTFASHSRSRDQRGAR